MEPEVRDVFDLILENHTVNRFWDIGANIGYYSWFVQSKGSCEKILMFEPFKENLNLIDKTIKANCLKNIVVFGKAVSDSVGKTSFMVDEFSGATGQLEDFYDAENEYAIASAYGLKNKVEVETISLDSVIENGEVIPDFVKIDIEEAEALLFEGARIILERNESVYVLETYNMELLDNLAGFNNTIYKIDEASNYIIIPSRFDLLIEVIGSKYTLYDA